MYINSYVAITDKLVLIDGKEQDLSFLNHEDSYLTQLYRHYGMNYPKFFKMDDLCKAGFLGAELLLGTPKDMVHDWAIVSFTSTSSISTDINYQHTIIRRDNYYPSPSIFVYTLANIMSGEVAIRHHLQGESSVYVLPEFDSERMIEVVDMLRQRTPRLSHILLCWGDSLDGKIDVMMCDISCGGSSGGAKDLDILNLDIIRSEMNINNK